jgi:hypothetical protein
VGGGGAQRPVLCVNELKKTGARSAGAHTRGQNLIEIREKDKKIKQKIPNKYFIKFTEEPKICIHILIRIRIRN